LNVLIPQPGVDILGVRETMVGYKCNNYRGLSR